MLTSVSGSVASSLLLGVAVTVLTGPGADHMMQSGVGGGQSREAHRVVEIRSYNLKPGTRERFHQRFVRDSLPMLQRRGIDVVAYGASAHDRDSYFLMRSYPSLDDRIRSENEFYGSAEWREGPREAVLADIDTNATVVVDLDPSTIRWLREIRPSGA